MRIIICRKDGFLEIKDDVLQAEYLGNRFVIEQPNEKILTLLLDENIQTINCQDISDIQGKITEHTIRADERRKVCEEFRKGFREIYEKGKDLTISQADFSICMLIAEIEG